MNNPKTLLTFLAGALLALGVSGCSNQGEQQAPAEPTQRTPAEQPSQPRQAVARIDSKSGSSMFGSASFRQEGDTVLFRVTISGAEPGLHAVHIHEFGDCSAEDGSSAGGHWNPTGDEHGRWGEPRHHLGDIGNIEVGEDGEGSLELATDVWSVGTGDENDVIGKSIVVHGGADDFVSQPSGAAGARIGCGAIAPDEA
ncbi:MAG: superoxide dismutase family protein [Armatimonadetes bacterium]|nr:superoxide dismutase family protein [Armatimonadota bacterium]